MKDKFLLLALAIITLSLISFSSATLNVALADQGTNVKNKTSGNLLSSADLTVSIYDASTGGNLIYNETFSGAIFNGSWNIMLGENSSNPLSLEFGKQYYKDYAINGSDLDFINLTGSTVERQFFYSPLGDVGGEDISSSANLTISNMTATGNITASWFSGNVNASDIQNNNWLEDSQESNLNVNSSDYWDGLNTFNSTQFENNGGTFNILTSWLDTIYLKLTSSFGGDVSGTYDNLQISANVIGDSELNYTQVTLSDFTNDNQYVTQTYGNSTYLLATGDSASGTYEFNSGWASGGLTIQNGDIYAQTGYFYNISSLQVNTLEINGSLLPDADNTFTLGNGTSRWKDLFLSGSLFGNDISLSWGNLTSYPSACSSSQYISAFGDTLTCASIAITISQISDIANANVNSSGYWDGLDSPSDINAADITDDGTYLLATGDTATGNYTFDSGTFFIDSSSDRIGINTSSPQNTLNIIGTFNITNLTGILGLYQNSDGYIGIGTSTPLNLLHLYASGKDASLQFEAPTATGNQGPSNPSTTADDSSVGTISWTNPENITSSDDSRSTVTFSAVNEITHYLNATSFGFTIPSDATISGIKIEWEKFVDGGQIVIDDAIRVIKGGVIGLTDLKNASSWPQTEAYVTYGNSSYLWGETWTVGDINSAGFGAALSAKCTATCSGRKGLVDNVRITVYYTTPGRNWTSGADYNDSGKFKISYSQTLGTDDRITIDESGKVGINTSTPKNTLNVLGDINFTGLIYGDGSQLTGITSGLWTNSSGNATYTAGNVGIGTTTPQNTLNIIGDFNISNSTGSLGLYQDSNSRVGIGTSSPTSIFHAIGSALFNITADVFQIKNNDKTLFEVNGTSERINISGLFNLFNSVSPSSPSGGDIFFNTSLGIPQFHDGSKWNTFGTLNAVIEVPVGTIAAFNETCPAGWTEFTDAQGRYIVGLPSGGNLGVSVGAALSDQENRSVGQHNHGVTDPGHVHGPGSSNRFANNLDGGLADASGATNFGTYSVSETTASNTTGVTIDNEGSTAGTNAPYIQLRWCEKTTDDSLFKNSNFDTYLANTTHEFGIGTTSPTETLEVNGSVKITGTASGTPSANTTYAEALPKAWVNFDGTSCSGTSGSCTTASCTIRDSFNIECVDRTATGLYSIYWDRNFADGNYTISGVTRFNTAAGTATTHVMIQNTAAALSTTDADIRVMSEAGANANPEVVSIIAFGRQ